MAFAYDLFTYARKKTGFRAIAYGIPAMLNIALNLYLIPKEGIMGAARATFITFGFYFMMMTFFVYFQFIGNKEY